MINNGISITSYTGATILILRSRTLSDLKKRISEKLLKITGLYINKNESEVIVFNWVNGKLFPPIIVILLRNHTQLKSVNNIKYLDLYTDNKLNWDKNTEHICTKNSKLTNKLFRVCRNLYRYSNIAWKSMFKGTINAFMYYVSFTFVHTLIKNKKQIDFIRRKVLLYAVGDSIIQYYTWLLHQ